MILPELQNDPNIPGSLRGSLKFQGRDVVLMICPDDATLAQCLASAEQALSMLPEIDRKAKDVAMNKLLSEYNEGWRHYEYVTESGSVVEVNDPELNASDFKTRLTMTSLEIMGANSYTVLYDDGKMFGGHAVVITSFDGAVFSDAYAELFG